MKNNQGTIKEKKLSERQETHLHYRSLGEHYSITVTIGSKEPNQMMKRPNQLYSKIIKPLSERFISEIKPRKNDLQLVKT